MGYQFLVGQSSNLLATTVLVTGGGGGGGEKRGTSPDQAPCDNHTSADCTKNTSRSRGSSVATTNLFRRATWIFVFFSLRLCAAMCAVCGVVKMCVVVGCWSVSFNIK